MVKPGPHPRLTTREEFELWQSREAGVSVKDCASYFNVSVATVLRILAKLRKRFGRMEKLPNGRRARAYLTRREIQAVE
jgi:transposase